MTRAVGEVGGLLVLVLGLSAAEARQLSAQSVMSVIVAGADGASEQILLSEPIATQYTSTPARSRDGRLIAYTESYTKDALGRLSAFDLASRRSASSSPRTI